jgi:hypothetical protein
MPKSNIDRAFFDAHYPRAALNNKPLTAGRKHGIHAIFDVWDAIPGHDSLDWLAYALATALA